MSQERDNYIAGLIEKKLSEKNVNRMDHDAAIKALSGCVMAGMLISEYKRNYGVLI